MKQPDFLFSSSYGYIYPELTLEPLTGPDDLPVSRPFCFLAGTASGSKVGAGQTGGAAPKMHRRKAGSA